MSGRVRGMASCRNSWHDPGSEPLLAALERLVADHMSRQESVAAPASNSSSHTRRGEPEPVLAALQGFLAVHGAGSRPRRALQNPHVLPAALQHFLADLAPHARPPLTHLHHDLSHEGNYGRYFERQRRLQTAEEEEVRVHVLSAIGTCPTLQVIQLPSAYQIGCSGRVEEAEALLGGLASISHKSALETLELPRCEGLGSEAACVALGAFLRGNRTLRELDLSFTHMDAGGLGQLSRALEANPHSALRVLDLSGNKLLGSGKAGGGAAHLAALLHHTLLEELKIQNIDLDVKGAEVIAQALASNTTLQGLEIGGYNDDLEALDILIRIGLGGSGLGKQSREERGRKAGRRKRRRETVGNRSIVRLCIERMRDESVADVILLLGTNPVLKKCTLKSHDLHITRRGHKILCSKLNRNEYY